jgi:WD40 repeat protein
MNEASIYTVGGTVQAGNGIYIPRQADEELFLLCQQRKFAYVLTSRQMGKSSLMVRTKQRIANDGFQSVVVDLISLGGVKVTVEQWYLGFLTVIEDTLLLETNMVDWWENYAHLSFTQRFTLFFEKVLLAEVESPIVIFVDEIDTTLSLDFTDDFFAVIRYLYIARAHIPELHRLSFVLIGVATPGALIRDSKRTPFNIGYRVELTGFQLQEVQPLAQGLAKVGNPQALIEAILHWTGGQPFLTQKLCQLVLATGTTTAPGEEEVWIEQLVRSRIIENWEAKDEPEHLRTVRDRILRSTQQRTGQLLGLYQQILQQGKIVADGSPEQMELQLSGLVVKQEGTLKVYNQIYRLVFDEIWVEKEFAALRPAFYSEALSGWVANHQDESWLLRGKVLDEALVWAEAKSLSSQDYQFLAASQEGERLRSQEALLAEQQARKLEQLEAEISLEAEKKKQIQIQLEQEKKVRLLAQTRNRIAVFSLIVVTIVSIFALTQWIEAEKGKQNAELNAQILHSENLSTTKQEFDGLIEALRASQKLHKWWVADDIKMRSILTLQQAVYGVKEHKRLEGHDYRVNSISVSQDNKVIASASDDGTIRLWNLDGVFLKPLNLPGKPIVSSVNFSPDGKLIVSGSDDSTINLWTREGDFIKSLKGHTEGVNSVSFSPDGKAIASASRDRTIKLWNLEGDVLKVLNVGDWVNSIRFSPNGKTLVSGTENGMIQLWDLNGNLLNSWQAYEYKVYSVNFSPDGKNIASTGGDRTIKLWNSNGKLLRTFRGHKDEVQSVSFSHNGKNIASASKDKTIKIWNLNGILLRTLQGHNDTVTSISFLDNDKMLVSGSSDNTVRLWNFNERSINTLPDDDEINTVSFSPNSQTFVSASKAGAVKIWNRDTTLLKTLTQPDPKLISDLIKSIVFSPNGKFIISADGTTLKIMTLDGTLLKTLEGHQDIVNSISMSSDNKLIASASEDRTIKIWSINGNLLKTLEGHTNSVNSVSFSPNGKWIVSSGKDNEIKLWNLNGILLKSWKGHIDSINSVMFSPDGKTIASASNDKTVKLWTRDGKLLEILKGHLARVNSISFSPNSQFIISGSSDRTLKVWSLDGKQIKTLQGHTDEVSSVSFSLDGKTIVSASNKEVIIWNLDLDNLIKRACNFLGDYLRNSPNVSNSDRALCHQ